MMKLHTKRESKPNIMIKKKNNAYLLTKKDFNASIKYAGGLTG